MPELPEVEVVRAGLEIDRNEWDKARATIGEILAVDPQDLEGRSLLATIHWLRDDQAAYAAEIIRAGIESISKGQVEAAQVLGLRPLQIFRLIIFKQALIAIYDNANSLHTNAYDEAVTTPSTESVRRALAIQLIINKEWGLAMNENPVQGSFVIDQLTDLVEEAVLAVVKRSGVTEPFSRAKIIAGVRKACQGRPVSEDQLQVLAQQVEESIRSLGQAEVDAHEVGLAILAPLRCLDEVAYLRFASVYQAFDSLEDFETAIGELRADHAASEQAGADR